VVVGVWAEAAGTMAASVRAARREARSGRDMVGSGGSGTRVSRGDGERFRGAGAGCGGGAARHGAPEGGRDPGDAHSVTAGRQHRLAQFHLWWHH
jgi:hypothetical protein